MSWKLALQQLPKDFQSVKRIANTIQNATVMSLARAKESDIRRAYEAVKGAVSPRLHVF